MWGGTTTRSQLNRTIHSLQRANPTPEAPTENPAIPSIKPTRRLSFLREKEIVSNLAFLSATTDNGKKVTAVCIEENSSEGITIRITSNSGDLSVVTAGFMRLAEVLKQASRRENPKTEDVEALLRQIVKLDECRILTRLRSRHVKSSKSAGKPALVHQLCQAVKDITIQPRKSQPRNSLIIASIKAKTECLQNLFNKLEAISKLDKERAQVHDLLSLIVRNAYELTSASDLDSAFQSSKLNSNLQKHLPTAVGKLGRYYSAAFELVCAARDKECPVFHRIQVEPFRVDKPASISEAGRIHAEIQLLFFYELYPSHPRPRVICASKSACYLCNLFFTLHGKFYMPRSHGRIYERWILPDWLDVPAERCGELAAITTKLRTILETKIKKAPKSTKGYFYPNESVLLPLGQWPSSVTLGALSAASRLTVRPPSQGAKPSTPSRSKTPLTPPKTLSEKPNSSHGEMRSCNIMLRKQSPAGRVVIGHEELPYSAHITAATPPLRLRLGKLTLQFDFGHASPCQLLMARVKGPMCRYQIVRIEDIPTAAEIKLGLSSHASKGLNFQLPIAGEKFICISFIWDEQ